MISFDPKEETIQKVHQLLLGGIGPRPIAFVSSVDEKGVNNLAPFSFFNAFSANPPIVVFSPARNGRTSETKDTHENVKKVPEVVINVVTYDIVEQVVLASSPYPKGVDEFVEAGFTPLDSDLVRPKRVKESPVQYECKVLEIKELGTGGASGNLVICEVVKIHVREDLLDANGQIDQKKINLVSRMGGSWYCHSNEASMFEAERPLTTTGVGFTKIPQDILNSTVLTGNDLGKLGRILELPDETEVNEFKLIDLSDLFISLEDEPEKLEIALHQKAQEYLRESKIEEAWKTLLAFNN
ncbi:MAG TPA: flavin reductase family protein [Crocinitomicaceae bacterium]|nr:flavin reductase family protein [Crocinitomicaceae bacterium]